MPKNKVVKTKAGRRPAGPLRRARLAKPLVAALALCLIAAGVAATRWEPVRHRVGLAPLAEPAPPPQPQGGLVLSKEYVYAGGRMVATEEPMPLGGPAPTALVAEAVSAPNVSLTWAAPASGTVTGYVVERRHSPSADPVVISTGSNAPGFTDTTVAENAAYLYRVRALFADGGTSGYGNSDLATTVVFTDGPLEGKPIKADHLTQARRAVKAVRDLAVPQLGEPTWTYPDPVSSPPEQRRVIYLEDLTELRTNLAPALAALGVAPLDDDPTLGRGQLIKGAHIEAVRAKVR